MGISNSKRYSILIFFSSFYKDDFLENTKIFSLLEPEFLLLSF
ncbi:hypothetical protein LEP1GSC115_0024 [Leptospira interrogans serovar Australis str. 200703203]|uniref:Uncharacterized protein n=1 Tax=Leptospira interrogans serovar Australis str. 200703203 TaxID=1085541 RepID=N1UKP7_LEPIR|nr:hypothetical protein LEP1GSC115_0024 [Leptospira interrogans serovar Australis str. 200703203]